MNHCTALLVLLLACGLMGCAEIPFARTYSISGSYDGAEVSASVRLEPSPPKKKADPKVMKEPAVEAMGPRTIDFRTERIVDPPSPAVAWPLIVTRL